MKKICIVTATRAEYGLLKPLIKKFDNSKNIELKIVATGAHLSPEFGYTYKEIEKDGFIIDRKIEMLMSSDTDSSISKSMGLAMISFADYFENNEFDMIVILGDRYESLSIAICAMNKKIPIAHLYGGEITEGAIDDSIRHAITKLSYLHFTGNEVYRNRVIQLGEDPSRVYDVGALGVENSLNEKLLTYNELEKSLNINLKNKFSVVTYHSVTLEDNTHETQILNLINAIDKFKDRVFIFTKANADVGGRIINKKLKEYCDNSVNAILVDSLGMIRYLTSLKYCDCVIGNSSSGIIEVPSFSKPTVNIGDRQKGRLSAKSVINCGNDTKDIINAMELAYSNEFVKSIQNIYNPYGDGNTSEKIFKIIEKYLFDEDIDLKKKFNNLF